MSSTICKTSLTHKGQFDSLKEKTGVEKFENALLQTSNARITSNILIGK